jgi:hypothetical protein
VVNCKGLQSSKVIGSNPIGASKIYFDCQYFLAIFFTSFFMNTLSRTVVDPLSSKSKVKFFGDFKAELRKTLLLLEKELTIEIERDFTLDTFDVGTYDIKIRVRDESKGTQKIISAIFRFHHNDEKFGNVHIEVLVSELSEKNKSEFLGKYLVTNRKKIIPDVVAMVMRGI